MTQYCTKCGAELTGDCVFCPRCGKALPKASDGNCEWGEVGSLLARTCLYFVKGFLFLILGGIVFACSASSFGLLIVGAVLLYHFASGNLWALPSFLVTEPGIHGIGGIPLLLGGIAAIFIAVLFLLGVISIVKVYSLERRKHIKPKGVSA